MGYTMRVTSHHLDSLSHQVTGVVNIFSLGRPVSEEEAGGAGVTEASLGSRRGFSRNCGKGSGNMKF